MARLKITQVKSRIGATAQQRKNLDALGLRKIRQSVEHEDSVIIKGMLERVKHLVTIESLPGVSLTAATAKSWPDLISIPKASMGFLFMPIRKIVMLKRTPLSIFPIHRRWTAFWRMRKAIGCLW